MLWLVEIFTPWYNRLKSRDEMKNKITRNMAALQMLKNDVKLIVEAILCRKYLFAQYPVSKFT